METNVRPTKSLFHWISLARMIGEQKIIHCQKSETIKSIIYPSIIYLSQKKMLPKIESTSNYLEIVITQLLEQASHRPL